MTISWDVCDVRAQQAAGKDRRDPVLHVIYGLIKEEGKFISLHNIRRSS